MRKSVNKKYQFGIFAKIFASNYQSFDIKESSFELHNDCTNVIQFIDILSISALKKGLIWDGFIITVDGKDKQTISGIDKSQSQNLLDALLKNQDTFIKKLIKQTTEKANHAILEAKAIFNDNQYLRLGKTLDKASEYINKYQELLPALQTFHIKKHCVNLFDYEDIVLILSNTEAYIKQKNQFYIKQQQQAFKSFFDTIESNPLTSKQRLACIIDEQSNLVLAGAGTGKTSTIIGKAGYLMANNNANESEILLLAFGNKAAKEMQDRIVKKLNNTQLKASTFHAIGKHIIAQVEGRQPNLSDLAE